MPAPFQDIMNLKDEDAETLIERMDDDEMDKESFHSGSLGKQKLNQNQ